MPKGRTAYRTELGRMRIADSANELARLADESIDLIVTSPPFALLREKEYSNESQAKYVEWLGRFGAAAHAKLKPTGSFVVDLGGAYQKGLPIRSLYNFEVVIDFVDRLGYHLAEEFYWYNPAKLPAPIEWVCIRKIRVKDSVNTIWWFSRTENPKADTARISQAPGADGQIWKTGPNSPDGTQDATNLLSISNTESNSPYLQRCRQHGLKAHPARFPEALPRFFIRMLTEPGDLVVDIFAGSNTTGHAAETLGRRWLSVEQNPDYAYTSTLRFLDDRDTDEIQDALTQMRNGRTVEASRRQLTLLGA